MDDIVMKNWRMRAKKVLSKGRRLLLKCWWIKPRNEELQREIWLLRLDLDILKQMLRRDCPLIMKLPEPVRKFLSKAA